MNEQIDLATDDLARNLNTIRVLFVGLENLVLEGTTKHTKDNDNLKNIQKISYNIEHLIGAMTNDVQLIKNENQKSK